MKVIEQNYSEDNPIHLSKEEILILRYMLTSLKLIKGVECVELIPSRNKTNHNGKLLINIIESGTIEDKTFLKNFIKETNRLIKEQNKPSNNDFFITTSAPLETISSPEMKSLAKKEIVSSYILLDRNGRYSNIQDYLKDYIMSFGELVKVDNIKALELKKSVISSNNKRKK